MAWLMLPRACTDFPRAVEKGFGVPGFGYQGYNHTFGGHLRTAITWDHVSSLGSLTLPKSYRKQSKLFVQRVLSLVLEMSCT